MIKARSFAKSEIFDLHHIALKGGGWQVVRSKIRTTEEAIKRLHTLANKARVWNNSLDLFQSIPAIGKAEVTEKENILIDYLEPDDYRLRVRIYDCIREFLLVAILFGIADGEKIRNPLQLMQG